MASTFTCMASGATTSIKRRCWHSPSVTTVLNALVLSLGTFALYGLDLAERRAGTQVAVERAWFVEKGACMRWVSLQVAVSFTVLMLTNCAAVNDPTADEFGASEAPLVDGSGSPVRCADGKKALICHRPPGNPRSAHTLCVGAPAVSAHLAQHGDAPGICSGDGKGSGYHTFDGTTGSGGGGDGGLSENGGGEGKGGVASDGGASTGAGPGSHATSADAGAANDARDAGLVIN